MIPWIAVGAAWWGPLWDKRYQKCVVHPTEMTTALTMDLGRSQPLVEIEEAAEPNPE
jgi:hypothetical protein